MNMIRSTTKNTSNFMSNTTHLLAALILLCSSCLAMATPEEDVEKGTEAFNRGDVVDAMHYYQKAAETGYAPAMAKLGYILDQSEQEKEAIEWYTKAVEQGNPEAQHLLGEKYSGGGEGVDQDLSKASELIHKAAEGGHINAMHTLVTAYERGGIGLEPDQEKVVYWLEQGARLKDLWSIERLMDAYRWGKSGLPVDETKAQLWESRLPSVNAK